MILHYQPVVLSARQDLSTSIFILCKIPGSILIVSPKWNLRLRCLFSLIWSSPQFRPPHHSKHATLNPAMRLWLLTFSSKSIDVNFSSEVETFVAERPPCILPFKPVWALAVSPEQSRLELGKGIQSLFNRIVYARSLCTVVWFPTMAVLYSKLFSNGAGIPEPAPYFSCAISVHEILA